MKLLLSFLAGVSSFLFVTWLAITPDLSNPSTVVLTALTWLAGLVFGGWSVGIAMFLYAHVVANSVSPRRVTAGAPPGYELLPDYPVASPLTDSPPSPPPSDVEVVENDYEDEDWWLKGKRPYGEAG